MHRQKQDKHFDGNGKLEIILHEHEIEKAREINDWKNALELVEACQGKGAAAALAAAKAGTSNADPLINFLYAESKLEIWLEDHQPFEKYISKAKSELLSVKKCLLLCISAGGSNNSVVPDAHLLLAKIYFASGLYEEALLELEKSHFTQISIQTSLSLRNYQLISEAWAIRSYSIEKVGRASQIKNEDEKRAEIIKGYLQCAEMSIAYFQRADKLILERNACLAAVSTTASSTTEREKEKDKESKKSKSKESTIKEETASFKSQDQGDSVSSIPPPNILAPVVIEKKPRIGSLIEYSIRRGPILLLEDKKIEEAIRKLQWLLRTVDNQFFSPFRLHLSRRLSEVLIRYKFVPPEYIPLEKEEKKGESQKIIKPKMLQGRGLFSPQNIWEDIYLLLLISETTVIRDGVLNRAPEFAKAREIANTNTATIFDLLTLISGRWNNFSLVHELIDQTLKFSFEEEHIWGQYCLSYYSSGIHNAKAIRATKIAADYKKRPTAYFLLAAQEELMKFRTVEATLLIDKALVNERRGNGRMLSRALLFEGITKFLKSFEKHVNKDRVFDLEASATCLKEAAELDPNDHLIMHWLARAQAWLGNIDMAMNAAIKSIRAFPFHLPTLQLIILLLSAQKNFNDALSLCDETLEEYPEHLGFLQLKAVVEEKLFGPETSINTLKQMLVIWKNWFEDFGAASTFRCDSPDLKSSVYSNLQIPSPTDRDGTASVASYRAASIAGSSTKTGTLTAGELRGDSALSEIASSMSLHGSLAQSTTSGDLAWSAQITIWTMLADLYLKLDQPSQAISSIEEAMQISSLHPEVLFYKGLVQEHLKDYKEARNMYEAAIAVKPNHIKSLQHLASMHQYFDSLQLAEKLLQDALRLDPYDHYTWYNLGKVLEALEDYSEAGDCMATALDIEANAPILPFSTIPVCFE